MDNQSPQDLSVLQPGDESKILERAFVPEHIPSLMCSISKGIPFLAGEYLGFASENWLILVGYPLDGVYTEDSCERAIIQARSVYCPDTLLFIGPELPASLQAACKERSQDFYYTLDLAEYHPKAQLKRALRRASEQLVISHENSFQREHKSITSEFLKHHTLPTMVAELYREMPAYLANSSSAILLCARDLRGRLCAYYVVEQAARGFDAYLLGCYSRTNYIPYASDLLFQAMIGSAQEAGKKTINLGLGVNEGIRRFKQKWGGQATLRYEYCECYFGRSKTLKMIDMLLQGKL